MDVQGCEAEIIAEAIAPLTRKARRVHVGTHGRDIEAELRRLMSAAGWVHTRDWPWHCEAERNTAASGSKMACRARSIRRWTGIPF